MVLLNEVIARRAGWRRYEERISSAPTTVPGEQIRLDSGDRVPRLARVIEGSGTALTREGTPMPLTPGNEVSAGARVLGGPVILELLGERPFEPRPSHFVPPPVARRYLAALGPVSLGNAALTALFTRSPLRTFEAMLLVNPRPALIGMETAMIAAASRVLRGGVTVVGTRHGRPVRLPDILILDGPRVLVSGMEMCDVIAMDSTWIPPASVRWEAPSQRRRARPGAMLLVCLGFIGISDPLRPTVRRAVTRCREAGVRVIMITGDHPATAQAVARQAGVLDSDGGEVLLAGQLASFENGELDRRLESARVIARATPLDKLRIIEGLRRSGHVVAMTGDGVNDAPALRLADVGVAMGRAGTEVARQAADVVLADDDFSTLVETLIEGRGFWRNMRRGIALLLGGNLGELGLIVGANLLGFGSPLTVRQILMVNLITDALPSLAIVLQREHLNRSEEQRDRSPRESIHGDGDRLD